jgi:hypothetical protein
VEVTLPDDKLESWKEIAAFIGKDERTARRWARERGLPVHRVPGEKRSSVFSSRTEIGQWLTGHLEDPAETSSKAPESQSKAPILREYWRKYWRKYWIAAGVAAVVLAAVSALALFPTALRPRRPSRISFTDNAVQAWDAQGHRLWTYTFAQRFDTYPLQHIASLEELSRVGDFKGDGDREILVVAPFRTGPNPSDIPRFEVDCFSSRGKLLWSYVPDAKFRFGEHELHGPWQVYDVFVSEHEARPAIWVALEHYVWGNSFVAQLDPETGKATVRYVNTGIIYKLNELQTPRGTFLLAAGFNNEYEAGVLALVDETRPFAASPQTEGTRHKCDSCPPGDPDAYLVFPRSEINQLRGIYQDPVRTIAVEGEDIEITKWELEKTVAVSTIYRFRADAGLGPVSLRYDSNYDMLHRELSAAHKLNHSLENCPERLHPKSVRMWTPSTGWTKLTFAPAKASE